MGLTVLTKTRCISGRVVLLYDALPNLDGSFTVTLFHPFEGEAGLNTLDTPQKVRSFFEKHYPDALPH
ncbi:MAG: hypothetical protein R2795_02940 [Saprospiraceae bacterium]